MCAMTSEGAFFFFTNHVQIKCATIYKEGRKTDYLSNNRTSLRLTKNHNVLFKGVYHLLILRCYQEVCLPLIVYHSSLFKFGITSIFSWIRRINAIHLYCKFLEKVRVAHKF